MPVVARRKDGKNESLSDVRLDELEFEVDPKIVSRIDRDIREIYRNVSGANLSRNIPAWKIRSHRLDGVGIGTSETRIGHGLGRQPTEYSVFLKADARWWESRRADQKYIYLVANTAVSADILVKG